MMILLFILLWVASGFISLIVAAKLHRKEIESGGLVICVLVGFFAPVVLLVSYICNEGLDDLVSWINKKLNIK